MDPNDDFEPLTVLFRNGDTDVTMTVISRKVWNAPNADIKRVYFDFFFTPRSVKPVSKFYEVLSGGTRVSALLFDSEDGRQFAYEYGFSADTKKDRFNIDAAMGFLIENIVLRDRDRLNNHQSDSGVLSQSGTDPNYETNLLLQKIFKGDSFGR